MIERRMILLFGLLLLGYLSGYYLGYTPGSQSVLAVALGVLGGSYVLWLAEGGLDG